ncbi:hypothetical protein J6590_107099, partial [Homalodisca vitripennis]
CTTSAQSRLSPRISRHYRNTKQVLILKLTPPPRHMTHYLVHDFSSVSSLPTYLATLPEYQTGSYSNIDNPAPTHDTLPGARLQLTTLPEYQTGSYSNIDNPAPLTQHTTWFTTSAQSRLSPRISRYSRNTKQVLILKLTPPPLSSLATYLATLSEYQTGSYSNINTPSPSHDTLPGARLQLSLVYRHVLTLILTTPPRHMTHYLVHDFSSVSSIATYLATLPEYQTGSYSNIDNPSPSHDTLPGARLQLSLVSRHVSRDTPGLPNSSVSSLATYLATLPEYQTSSYSKINTPSPSHDTLPGARLQLSLVSPHVSRDTPGIPNSSVSSPPTYLATLPEYQTGSYSKINTPPSVSRHVSRDTPEYQTGSYSKINTPPRHMTHYLVHDFSSVSSLPRISRHSRNTKQSRLSHVSRDTRNTKQMINHYLVHDFSSVFSVSALLRGNTKQVLNLISIIPAPINTII